MIDNFIIYPETLQYLAKINPFTDKRLLELEAIAIKENRPIVQRDVAIFLQLLLKMNRPSSILELGANIGFSSCCMSQALDNNVQIDTIEFNPANVAVARENVPANVAVIESEAIAFLEGCEKQYDFIFIDANKKDNQRYIELCESRLTANGVICIDNILWKGRTAARSLVDENSMESTQEIRAFNRWMMEHPSFDSQILPIGDGIILAVKKF